MRIPYSCYLIQLLLFCKTRSALESSNATNNNNVSFERLNESLKFQNTTGSSRSQHITNANDTCDAQPKATGEDTVHRVRRGVLKPSRKTKDFNITGVFWDDVWKSSNIDWVAKRVDNEIRPSDRQFFHTLIPDTIFSLRDTCINLDQKDERDFTVLANISWKDRQPSLRYPPVPPQCTFGRSSGFLCVLLDDGNSCHYVSGWGQDRVQALVDGRHSSCGHRQQLHMMLHALGLMHEHDRGDALQFVSLHPRLRTLASANDPIEYRIPQDNCSLFQQNASSLPFDFSSIMLHDGSFQTDSVQMDFELPLIPKRSGDMRDLLAIRRPGLSHFDRFKLRYLYGCRAKNCPSARPCENFGFRNKLCQCECAPGYAGKHCELIRKPPKNPCLRTVTHTSNFTLKATNCHPVSNEPFNFTIDLAGEKSNRFAITVNMTPVLAVLETLRVLPTCEHARLYFTGTGRARPQMVCAAQLMQSPVTLRTTYSSGMLLLLLKLPNSPRAPGEPDPVAAAISAIHVDISSEPHPSEELQVDTSRPPPPNTTTSTSTTPESPTTASPTPATEPPTPPPTTPPTTRRSTTLPKKKAPAMPRLDLGEAHKTAGKSNKAKAAVIISVAIVVVLVATVAMLACLLSNRRVDPEELEMEELQRANQAGEVSAALYAGGQM